MRFQEFFVERKVDPAKLAARTGRRYGKEDDYGYHKSDTVKGKYIPLKSYDEDWADEIDGLNWHLVKSLDTKYGRAEREKIFKKYTTREQTPVNKLQASQPFVRIEDEKVLKQKLATSKPIRVAKLAGHLIVLDGHHALMAALLRGEKVVSTNIVDYDNLEKDYYE